MTVRRISAVTCLLVAVLGLWWAPPAQAASETTEVDGVVYTFDPAQPAGGAIATDYTGSGGPVAIPSSITVDSVAYDVLGIGSRAFYDKNLTAVSLPSTVRVVGGSAFENNDISQLVLERGLLVIEGYAFKGNQLTSVTLPDSATTIGTGAFEDNPITSLTLGSTVTSIGEAAFKNNLIAGAMVIPDSVVSIGPSAFENSRITTLTLGRAVTTIGNYAFKNNLITGEVVIPDSVVSIGGSSFEANQIASLHFGSNVGNIGGAAFKGNRLTTLVIPDSVTALGQDTPTSEDVGSDVFMGNQLTSVTLGAGLTKVPVRAFWGNQLTEVTIPAGVTTVNSRAFDNNPGLGEVTFLGPAPAIEGAGGDRESLDTASGALVVRYQPQYDDSTAPGGFTPGSWHGYTSAMVGAPTFSGPATASFTVGVDGSWTPDTLGGDPTPSVSATGLPEGLQLDPVTGVISGSTMDAVGTYDVTVTAANGRLPDVSIHVALTVQPGAVAALEVSASDTTPGQGGTVTLTVNGTDAAGNDLGDVTDEVTFTSDVATDVVDGNSVTFPHASPHVITATHAATGVTGSVTVEVIPRAPGPAANGDNGNDGNQGDQGSPGDNGGPPSTALPDTGGPAAGSLLGLAGALLLAGGWLVGRSRRA